LRRLRSAGLGLRGFGLAFEPARVPLAGSAAAFTGARLRASRQMKSAMPPRTIAAPIAIPSTPVPLRPVSVDVEVGLTTGGVVVVGVLAAGCGSPGVSGLVGTCAAATPGPATINPTRNPAAALLTVTFTLRTLPV
jgi:hypothetical protein